MPTKLCQNTLDSLYAEYVKELFGRESRSGENWFFTYSVAGATLILHDLHIKKSCRGSLLVGRVWRAVLDTLVESGASDIFCLVFVSNPKVASILKLYTGIGFKIVSANNDIISLRYKIGAL